MRCSLVGMCIVVLLSTPAAWAQTPAGGSDGNNVMGTGLADRSPAENVRADAVRERAPGRVIDQARARHGALRDMRAAAQRTGETSMLAPEAPADGIGNSLSNLFGGSLSSLLTTFLNSGLSGALGGALGNQTGAGQLPLAGGQSGSGATGSGGVDLSGLPPEVIQLLANSPAGADLGLTRKSMDDSDAASAPQPKTSQRMQADGDQQQPDFVVRWADAMLSTIFTAVTVGLQTQDFIDLLKDVFRPFFIPESSGADATDGTAANGDTSSDQDGADGTDSGGDDGPLI